MIKKIGLILIIAFILIRANEFSIAQETSIDDSSAPTQNNCSFSCNSDKTKAYFSLTGTAFSCIKNVLDMMFLQDCEKYNILKVLKDNLKNAVYAALLLYVVLLGIKVTTSGIPEKREFFMAILKFGFVLYFALGDGLNDYVYKGGTAAMTDLSNYVMQAGTGTFCQFTAKDYDPGYEYSSYVGYY